MEEHENIFEKLDDIIRKKKEEIACLKKLMHQFENMSDTEGDTEGDTEKKDKKMKKKTATTPKK